MDIIHVVERELEFMIRFDHCRSRRERKILLENSKAPYPYYSSNRKRNESFEMRDIFRMPPNDIFFPPTGGPNDKGHRIHGASVIIGVPLSFE
ncbi:hypothetical protein NPIL_55951 [Nephila pilipes]|uniref:Uncharacterized protein n=1 Tax=Nephila pilipes TaxID=299642 RepID=A0A8X6NZE0_NEPPI|nr:hypothetical protein NPIL_55951 [Nephila pilipes]